MTRPTGLEQRHGRRCKGGKCSCPWQATVYSKRDKKRIRKLFYGHGAKDAAKRWKRDAEGAVERGELRAPTATTVREAAEAFMAGAKNGSIPTASGGRYKPATLRGYRVGFDKRVLPALGHKRLSDVRRADVQELADRLTAEGLSASTVQNTLDPLRAIYRRAIRRDEGSRSTRRRAWSCAGRTASVSASPPRPRPLRSSLPSPRVSVRCGLARSTPAYAAANCARCAGATSTWRPV